MSIYHQNLKHISRGKGQSACAAAAYRSGTKIYDQRLGKTHNYERKQGVDHTEILAPSYSPHWVNNRTQLWNQVEKKDTRINARPASELDIALPIELNQDQQIQLIKTFAETTLVSRGLIVDLACHDLNTHNPHAHLMFTTRKINEQGLGEKDREIKSKNFLNHLRKEWEEHANHALSQAQKTERIDHRSLEDQGIVTHLPQIHLGPNVCKMEARGIPTDRGDQYREIEAANAKLKTLYQQQEKLETQLKEEQKKAEEKAQPFSSLNDLDPERDTKLKWDHLNPRDTQKLNQAIRIHHEFQQIFNDPDFPQHKLRYDIELDAHAQFRFKSHNRGQTEYWVVSKTDYDFTLTQLEEWWQSPQYLPKKIHLTLNENQKPILQEYNINLGEYGKLQKTLPSILENILEKDKEKHGERKQKEEQPQEEVREKTKSSEQEMSREGYIEQVIELAVGIVADKAQTFSEFVNQLQDESITVEQEKHEDSIKLYYKLQLGEEGEVIAEDIELNQATLPDLIKKGIHYESPAENTEPLINENRNQSDHEVTNTNLNSESLTSTESEEEEQTKERIEEENRQQQEQERLRQQEEAQRKNARKAKKKNQDKDLEL